MKPGESRTKDNSMAFSSFISVFVGAGLNSTVANVSSEQGPSSALLTHLTVSTIGALARVF